VKCGQKCEVYSRVVGYHRPIQNWNKGKKEEFSQRLVFDQDISVESKYAKRGAPTTVMERVNKFVF
jgi:ribonucleoside-triphosphate reductase (formate)